MHGLNDVYHVSKPYSLKPCKSITESYPQLYLWMPLLKYKHSKWEKNVILQLKKKDFIKHKIAEEYSMSLINLHVKKE